MCAGTPLLSTFLGLLLDSLASVQPGSPATGHVGMWFDSGTGGPDWPLAMPMGIDSSASYSEHRGYLRVDVRSRGAQSVCRRLSGQPKQSVGQ